MSKLEHQIDELTEEIEAERMARIQAVVERKAVSRKHAAALEEHHRLRSDLYEVRAECSWLKEKIPPLAGRHTVAELEKRIVELCRERDELHRENKRLLAELAARDR